MADDLDQLQPRHRIEEVQADQPLRLRQRGAQVLQRNARGVGGEDRARLHPGLERGIDLLLQLEFFRHRLDDEIGIADALAVHIRHEAIQRVADVDALAHDLAEQLRGALDRAGDRLRLHVGERHTQALIGAPGRDVAAHRAGADDVDMLDAVAGACELLHLLAQEEHPDQVLRRRRHHQIGERGLFGPQHRDLVVAMLFPEIDQRIGRRIMFMRCGLFRLGAHAPGEQAPDRAEVQNRVQRPRPGPLQPAEHRVPHGVADVALLRHRIDQPERLGLAGIDGLAGQHQGHRLHRIDQPREAHGAAEAGMQAEHHLRKAKARAFDGNARLAGQRHFEAAAEAEAVNDGDGRNLQRFEAVDHRMGAADGDLDRPRIGGAAEFVDVGAGDETGFLGGADDEPGRPLALQRRQHRFEFFDQIGRQRVGAGALAIEQQPGDAVGIAGQLEVAVGASQRSGCGPSSSTRSPRRFMILLSMITPSRSAWRRPARRRCIRWRCRVWCPAASSR